MDKIELKKPDGTNYSKGRIVKLKDIIITEPKTSHKAGDASNEGKYMFFTSGEAIKHFDNFDFDGEYIVANTGGQASFTYVNDKFATSSDCFVFKTNENTKYISLLLNYNLQKINSIAFRGNGLKHLDKKYFNNLEFYIPCKEEQEVIVKLLLPYEKHLQEIKLTIDKLKELKKGMLQKMFPKAGKKIPEYRFPGFTEPWEHLMLIV